MPNSERILEKRLNKIQGAPYIESMKKNQLINLERQNLSHELAASLLSFIFWNPGKISQVNGDRVCVRWSKEDRYWFDKEALKAI